MGMGALVEEEAHRRRARVVSILYELVEDADAVSVQLEDVAQPRRERLVLTERLDVLEP